ncbi:MAG: hydroxymethylbilane synthase [Lachnospiraceae bacterium]|nr:hydroxymethylbilane synthase [Lachnospiraceae bacterium]
MGSEKREIRVGSRESKLAVAQTRLLLRKLEEHHPELVFRLVTMKTTGDMILDRSLDKVGGKGLFVKELDKALREKQIDFSVHSLKDMPMEQPMGMPIVAMGERGEVRDVLVYPRGRERWSRASGRPFVIGTSSERRRLQLKALFPEAEFSLLRGNVLTRLKKLDEGQYDAIVLAAAGLIRLGLAERIDEYLDTEVVIPAAGQAVLAVQGREGEDYSYLDCIDNQVARQEAEAERGFVRYLDGGCSSPIAAYAKRQAEGNIRLQGLYYDEKTGRHITGELTGAAEEGERLGIRLAKKLRKELQEGKQEEQRKKREETVTTQTKTKGWAEIKKQEGTKKQEETKEQAKKRAVGKVWLVGAGPSDVGLFTIKGAQVLSKAQVVVCDRLVGPGILQMIPEEAEIFDVGKSSGNHPVPQKEISRLLLEKALEGKRVVRLKGGDPFVFGRGGEELELLAASGIPFEVVPGVTAASAVTAYAGIPVTHRDYCSSVHLITAHKKRGSSESLDFETLAKLDGTLVFYMGLGELETICRGLLEAGMGKEMPAAVISRGTTAAQRQVFSTLVKLPEEAGKAEMISPALIVVGKVCSLSETFRWAQERPLGRRRILVTRPKKRSNQMAERLLALGAEVILLPAIRTEPIAENEALEEAFSHMGDYDWIAFTSAEGVDCFFDKMYEKGIDIRSLAGIQFAAIGPATGKALGKRGILPVLQPESFTGKALGESLAERMKPGERLLLPRADIGTREVLEPLLDAGASFVDIPVYRTIMAGNDRLLPKLLPDDIVTFTSASTVRGFAALYPESEYRSVLGLCIGEQTAKEARYYGIRTVVSDRAEMDSMVEKLLEIAGGMGQ